MRKAELEIGKVYAYSRTNDPSSTYHISGFIVDSIEIPQNWRSNAKQEVSGRFTKDDGTTNPDTQSTSVNIRKLIGEYLPLKHNLELREKNREIARLNKQIASTQIEALIKNNHELITKRLDIKFYDIRNQYDGNATITLDAKQFQNLVWAFKRLERHDEQAQKDEAERLRKAFEESKVNA